MLLDIISYIEIFPIHMLSDLNFWLPKFINDSNEAIENDQT